MPPGGHGVMIVALDYYATCINATNSPQALEVQICQGPYKFMYVVRFHCTAGHNLETTWVMIEALDYLTSINATNNTQATQFKSTVLSIGEAAIRAGYDTRHGGVFEKGSPTAVNSTVKVWWIQTESMLAMWKLYRHTSNTTYLQKLVQTAGFVRQHVLDNDYGEFYWQVEANGTYVPSRDLDKGTKGNRWKASYHSARLPLFLERWIQQSP